MADLTGRRLGKYELVDRLGQGGMAEVYKAYQPGMDRFVAIKVMHSHLADSDNFITRFRREAQLVGQLRHPHIVQVIDFDVAEDVYYMVMEYIKGTTLKAYIQQKGELPADEALRLAVQITDALAYAHQQGTIHRDIKPANVMFTDKTYINTVLTDFGIARIVGGGTQLTASGAFIGTPAYISPEIAQGHSADERSDIYSTGILLYEMLTGKVPFDADTPFAVIMKHVNEPLPSPRTLNIEVTDSIEQVLWTALAKSPDERYATATEFKEGLEQALQNYGKERPTVRSSKTDRNKADNQSTLPITPDENDNLATIITGTEDIVQEKPKRNLLPLVGVFTLIAMLAIGGFLALSSGDEDDGTSPSEPEITNIDLALTQVSADLAENEIDSAISTLSEQIDENPDNIELLNQRGNIYLSQFNDNLALADFSAVLAFDPDNLNAILGEGEIFYNQGDLDKAIDRFNTVLEADNQQSRAYALRGLSYLQLNDISQARSDLNRAIDRDENSALAQLGFAILDMNDNEYESALEKSSLAIESNNRLVDAYVVRGIADRELGNPGRALNDFETAIDLDPTIVQAYIERANIYLEQGELETAIQTYTAGLDVVQDPLLYLRRGEAYYENNNDGQAQINFEDALALDDQLVEAHYLLGRVAQDQDRIGDAIQRYTRVIEIDPTYEGIYGYRGWLYLDTDQYELAIADFEDQIDVFSDDIYAWEGLGNAKTELGDFQGAIEAFDEAINIDNSFANAYFGRGLAHSIENQFDQAVDDLTTAIDLNYYSEASAHYERGYAYLSMGEYELALNDFETSIAADEGRISVFFYKGVAEFNLGNYETAIESLVTARNLGYEPDFDFNKTLGLAYQQADLPEEALPYLNNAIEEDNDLDLIFQRGRVLIELEEYEDAIVDFDTLINQTYDELSDAYAFRGLAYDRLGENSRAIEDLDRAVSLDNNNANAFFQRGLYRFNNNDDSLSLEDFARAIELNPDFADTYYYYGTALINEGLPEEAIANLDMAIELGYDPLHFAYLNRGVAYERLDRYSDSIQSYNRALEIQPDYAIAYFNRGLAYYFIDDYENAVLNLTEAIELDYSNIGSAYYYRARSYMLQDDYVSAVPDFEIALESGSNFTDLAHFYLGFSNNEVGNHEAAIQNFTDALDAGYEPRYEALLNRGFSSAQFGDLEAAIVDYTRSITNNPTYARAYNNRAFVHLRLENYEDAIADFQFALELNYQPTYFIYNGLGNAYFALQEYELALEQYTVAINQRENQGLTGLSSFYADRSGVHLALGNIDDAIEDMSIAIEIDSTNSDYFIQRGQLFLENQMFDAAFNDFETATTLTTNLPLGWYFSGLAAVELQDFDTAVEKLERAIIIDPSFADAYLMLGDIAYERGNQRDALDYYQSYVDIEGFSADPRASVRIIQLEDDLGITSE